MIHFQTLEISSMEKNMSSRTPKWKKMPCLSEICSSCGRKSKVGHDNNTSPVTLFFGKNWGWTLLVLCFQDMTFNNFSGAIGHRNPSQAPWPHASSNPKLHYDPHGGKRRPPVVETNTKDIIQLPRLPLPLPPMRGIFNEAP